jgi:hypothetical protein
MERPWLKSNGTTSVDKNKLLLTAPSQ